MPLFYMTFGDWVMRNLYSRRRYESVEDGDTYDVSEVMRYVLGLMDCSVS